jgi:protein-S-isoprenylcysteine O-methyltransferase Ste14
MTPLPFVWPYALLFWVVLLWAFSPEFAILRRAQREQTASDSKSLQVIMFGQMVALLVSFPMAWVSALQIAPAHRIAALFIGLLMIVAGGLLRRHCFRMLGSSFTGDVKAHSDQVVVMRGAYRVLRHPSYTGGTMMYAGIGVGLGSWAGAILLTIAALAVYIYRINVEERALLAAIGDPYREFMSTRKRLLPFVY